MAVKKPRRTSGIRNNAAPTDLGHDIALRQNTPRELAAAQRVVDRAARDEDDRDLLMAALGLNAPLVIAYLAISAGLFALGHRLTRWGNPS